MVCVVFRGSRVSVPVSVPLFWFIGCHSTPRRECPSLLLVYLLHHARIYAPGTWDIGAGML